MDPNELRKEAAAKLSRAKSIQAELDSPECDFTAEQRTKREARVDQLITEASDEQAEAGKIVEAEAAAAKRRAAFA